MNLGDVVSEEEKPGQRIPLFPRRERVPRPWVIEGVAMRGQLGILFGEPSAGKSLLSLHIAVMVASGIEWGPFTLVDSGPVLLVNREDDVQEIDRRTWAIEKTQPIPEETPIEYLDRPSTHVAMRDEEGKLVKTPFYNELKEHIQETGAKLVILDPLIELAGNLDENNNVEMNFLVEALRQIAITTDCHHDRLRHSSGPPYPEGRNSGQYGWHARSIRHSGPCPLCQPSGHTAGRAWLRCAGGEA
ncbi:AAA family ATPase [Algihabitans albus]|uniref:AAA family ATPase n=1 Tax=Algihabitans albus TaxID=2164067 RepID=UPI0035CEE340